MDQGNTAFVLISAALVLLMTPGLAFFYGGMVKAKSVVSMMMLSFGSLGLVAVLWVLYGYAITFADIPVIAAYLILIALLFVTINAVVDMLYFWVDPRVRLG